MSLESHQEALYKASSDEREAYLDYFKKVCDKYGFGITTEDEFAHKHRRAIFHQFLNTTKLKVNNLFCVCYWVLDLYF